jgi:hypothetical protein
VLRSPANGSRLLSPGGGPVKLAWFGAPRYLEDCDAVFKAALAAGAKELQPLQDKELARRAQAAMAGGSDKKH